jgi:phage-related baseplate assembly protein
VETDEALRERYTLAWKNINGSTKYAYESWAREVSGVVSVMVMDSHPRGQGTVDVVIRGSAGIPSADLLSQVDTVVQENRPINDDVLVLGPTPVDVLIDAELVLVSGTPDVTISEVEERISALFTMPPALDSVAPLFIGEDLTLDRLVSVIMAVPGIKEVNFTLPESNVSVPTDGLAVLTDVSITHVWAEEV